MKRKAEREADREVADQVVEEFHTQRDGWVTTSISADMGTWRERFVRCAELARVRERKRIGASLCAGKGGSDE